MTIIQEKSFKDWLNIDLQNTIKALKVSFETDLSLMSKQLNIFDDQLKKGPFGQHIICRVSSFTSFKGKKGDEFFKIESVVMEPTDNGYKECPHPFDQNVAWEISSIINLKHAKEIGLKEIVKDGELYRAKYMPQTSRQYFNTLISCDLKTYEPVEQTIRERLLYSYGELLYDNFIGSKNKELEVEEIVISSILQHADDVYEKLQEERTALNERAKKIEIDEQEIEEAEKSLTKRQQDWRRVIAKVEEYEFLSSDAEIEEVREIHSWEPEEVVKNLQSLIYHASKDQLIYEEAIVGMLFRCLQLDVITILSGPSGTGKSSIVEILEKVLENTVVKMIPVQSSWTDTQDLLGYFNPLEKNFVASPFMEALSAARHDELSGKKKLHIICLDEMNLAHVEYYFSELLSAREKEVPSLSLYNKRYFLNAKRFIEQADAESELTDAYAYAIDLVNLYPYEFIIPKNVRFIGTLNMDHTVKPLSPKVIDRSFRIELRKLPSTNRRELKKKLEKTVLTGCLALDLDTFFDPLQEMELVEKEVGKIMELSDILEDIPDAALNSRGEAQVREYLRRTPESKRALNNVSIRSYLDQIILTKLLPRIEVSRQDKELMKTLEEFEGKIKNYPLSKEKLDQMMSRHTVIHF